MPDRTSQATSVTPIEPSFARRVAAGIRYAITGVGPANFFGPNQPLQPQAQEAQGRQFDYPVGFNLRTQPRDAEPVSFHQLRALGDSYDLLRLVIETRKDQIEKITWNIQPKLKSGMKPSERKNARATDPRIAQLEDFFASPDRENSWSTWLRMLLEDMLVIDAATLYKQRERGGQLYALRQIDGATIKRLIDDQGLTPAAPSPAYQQVLKGLPAVDYTTNDLLYLPHNRRVHRVYGYSPVEQIIMTVNIALRRQVSLLNYYTEGNTPEALIGTPEDWNPDQVAQFQAYWDSLLEGNLAARRHTKFVPGGLKYQPTREPVLKDDFDEWLARIVCYAFSVPPTPFIRQMNRATAETAQEAALQEGLAPIQNWVKNLIDRVIASEFDAADLEFVWNDDKEQDPTQAATINKIYVSAGIKTINEVRGELGLDPIDSADQAIIETATGVTLLDDVLNPPEPVEQPIVPGVPTPGQLPKGHEQPTEQSLAADGKDKKKVQKRTAKPAVRPINRDRKAVRTARGAITKTLTTFFNVEKASVAQRVAAAYREHLGKAESDSHADSIAAAGQPAWDSLYNALQDALTSIARDGGEQGLLQINIEDGDITHQVNDDAVSYAKNRAAEMIGKRRIGNDLVDNPDAKYAISDTTRGMIRDLVKQGEAEGWSGDKLADAIEADHAFSPARAETIARTEAATADVQGNMIAYRRSGVVTGKRWVLSNDHPEPDECNDNADAGVIPLGEDFPSGADAPPDHPNCECDVIPITGP